MCRRQVSFHCQAIFFQITYTRFQVRYSTIHAVQRTCFFPAQSLDSLWSSFGIQCHIRWSQRTDNDRHTLCRWAKRKLTNYTNLKWQWLQHKMFNASSGKMSITMLLNHVIRYKIECQSLLKQIYSNSISSPASKQHYCRIKNQN
jgi:hypothetical protein